MPGYFVHFIYAPLLDVEGEFRMTLPAFVPSPDVEGEFRMALSDEGDNTTVGSVLYESTGSHMLRDYRMYVSSLEYVTGPIHAFWRRVGTANGRSLRPGADGPVTYLGILLLAGVVFTEGYAFAAYDGGLDLYVRTSETMPQSRFMHYALDVDVSRDWWRAREWRLLGSIDVPEWQWTPYNSL